jgi:predicted amidophosphoribosyltransferase
VDRVVVPWAYRGAARALILDLKLRRDRSAAAPLAEAVHAAVLEDGLRAGVLTWVPARRSDVRKKGFDHAEVLARELGTELGLPVRRLLYRTGAVLHQTTLGAAERCTNLATAFASRSCPERVAIVDDLVTTGATASSCARSLRARGARWIEVLAPCYAARTGPGDRLLPEIHSEVSSHRA